MLLLVEGISYRAAITIGPGLYTLDKASNHHFLQGWGLSHILPDLEAVVPDIYTHVRISKSSKISFVQHFFFRS